MFSFVCFALLIITTTSNGEVVSNRNEICTRRNMYLDVGGQCDSYIECRDYYASDMQCPDGLHYDPSVKWPGYPCNYPQDFQCQDKRAIQQSLPTADCPHQYGYYASPLFTPDDCGHFRLCDKGQAFEMNCTSGLAFNADTAKCDWPENVPSCNADKYMGFKCPPYSAGVTNHKRDGHCISFYSCVHGIARILSCDPGFAFDERSGSCVDDDTVACRREDSIENTA